MTPEKPPLLNISNADAEQVASILKTHTRNCGNAEDSPCCAAAERVRLGLLDRLALPNAGAK